MTFSLANNTTTPLRMFEDYEIGSLPQEFVIGDCAVAKFKGKTVGISLIKSAIEDVQNFEIK